MLMVKVKAAHIPSLVHNFLLYLYIQTIRKRITIPPRNTWGTPTFLMDGTTDGHEKKNGLYNQVTNE